MERIVTRLDPQNVSYQFGECKFIFASPRSTGTEFPDFLPDRVAEFLGFENLDGGSVFEDLPGDFNETRYGEAQAQAAGVPAVLRLWNARKTF